MVSTSELSSTNTTKTKNKSSVSETGHAKNIANFQDLITFVTGYGATYNPSKTALKLPQLITLSTTSQAKLADVVTKKTAFNNAINDRIIAFTGIKALTTRLICALETTNASKEKVNDAKGFNRKMYGKRASSKQTPNNSNTPNPITISTAQLSYDQLIQHFAGLISVLQSETSFTPNENELKINTLITKQTDIIAKNNAVAIAYATVSNSRIARDKTLYDDTTGLISISLEVKKYVKSVYGPSSPEYAQVKGIKFTNLKR